MFIHTALRHLNNESPQVPSYPDFILALKYLDESNSLPAPEQHSVYRLILFWLLFCLIRPFYIVSYRCVRTTVTHVSSMRCFDLFQEKVISDGWLVKIFFWKIIMAWWTSSTHLTIISVNRLQFVGFIYIYIVHFLNLQLGVLIFNWRQQPGKLGN